MGNFKNAMRRMRQYTAAVKKNYDSREKEIEKISDYKGSPYYDKQVTAIDKGIEQKRVELAADVQHDLQNIVNDMRLNLTNRIAKAPTVDMVNNLAILEKFDTLTPARVRIYAEQMADCPLALELLQQIAKKHDIHISIPDTEEMMRAVDVIEGNMAAYINGYHGSDDNVSFTVKNLNRYFQGDDVYLGTTVGNTEQVDAGFWRDIVGIGSPAMLDPEGTTKDIKVQLYFSTVEKLHSYIQKQTADMEFGSQEYGKKVNEILNECPDIYGAAYREYIVTPKDSRQNVELQ